MEEIEDTEVGLKNCPTYVYRDFRTTEKEDGTRGGYYWIGSIELFLLKNNIIQLQVEGLQDNEGIDDAACQADVLVKYPDNIPLYDVILTILNKITDDHSYRYISHLDIEKAGITFPLSAESSQKMREIRNYITWKDFIFCSNKVFNENPHLNRNNPSNATYSGSAWIEFNRENVKYLEYYRDFDFSKCYKTPPLSWIMHVEPSTYRPKYFYPPLVCSASTAPPPHDVPEPNNWRHYPIGCQCLMTDEEKNEAYENQLHQIIYGEVDAIGTFTYDYPVISRQTSKDYYIATRGKIVWNIERDYENNKYIDNNEYKYEDFWRESDERAIVGKLTSSP